MNDIDIINSIVCKLKDEEIWFTQKTDPTWNNPSHYYKLDEYGDLTETAQKEIVKEVNSYIGDGAVDIEDAIDIWEQEALVDNRIAYREMLVTKFKDKPIVDGIEAYNSSVLKENNKITEEFWEDGEKYEYKGIVIQQSISDKGKKLYSILNRQEPFSIPDFSSLKAAKQYIDDNNLKSYKVTENYKRRLKEENNKSANLISDMFKSSDFDANSKSGQIVMRTSELFNALSDKGYDVQVSFDNGESTSAILLGQQGGQVLITITDTNQPLRAFTSGNFEINDDNIKILDDIKEQISVL